MPQYTHCDCWVTGWNVWKVCKCPNPLWFQVDCIKPNAQKPCLMEDHSCEWLWSLSFNLRLGIQMCICNCGNLQCKMSPHCSKNAIAGEQCTVNCISQESKPARPVCHCLSVFVCTVHCLQEVLATSSHLVHTLVARISNGQLPVVELVAHRCGRS